MLINLLNLFNEKKRDEQIRGTVLSIEPMFRNPISDVFSTVLDSQTYGRCADFEMNTYDCLDAYGMGARGKMKCKLLIDDLHECMARNKQINRVLRMRFERFKQVVTRERAWKDQFAPGPTMTSF